MPEQNAERGVEEVSTFKEALDHYNELLHGLMRNETPYNQEQTPGELFSRLVQVQTAGRKDRSISKIPIDLDHELANLADGASLAADQHKDLDAARLFLRVAMGLRVKETTPHTKNKPSGFERITVKGFMPHIRIRK